jgi:hypothetical protein
MDGMDRKGWISQLGVLYNEVSSVDGSKGASSHVEQFNEILRELKEVSDDEVVQNMDEVSTPGRDLHASGDANQEVKSKCAKLAEAFGYQLPKNELEDVEDLTLVTMTSDQSSVQSVSQEVSFEQVNQFVQLAPLGQEDRKKLEDVVSDFENELEGSQDPSKLRDLLNKAEDYSTDVTAKLAMLALQKGVTSILNLG